MAVNRDVNLNVTASEETGPATAAAGRNIDGLQRKVDGFNTKKPTAEVTRFTSAFTKSAKDGESGMQSLQRAIDDTEKRIAKIRSDFNAPGSNGVQLFGDLKQSERDLKSLQSAFTAFSVDVAKEGEQAGDAFARSFSKSSSSVLPELASPAGLAVVAALTPVIGAGVAAAVSAGLGIGLIGAAAVVQHNNPAIQRAFGTLRTDAVDVFKDATQPLVQPFVDAIGYADQLVTSEGPQLHKIFADLAPAVSPLVDDFGTLLSDILPGVDKAVQAFTQAARNPAVINSVNAVGDAFNSLFTEIGDNPKLIADTFADVNAIVKDGTKILQGFVQVASTLDLLRTVDDVNAVANPKPLTPGTVLDPNAPVKIVRVSQAYEDAAKAAGNFQESQSAAAAAALATGINFTTLGGDISKLADAANNEASAALQNLQNQMLALQGGQLGFNSSVLNVISTLKSGKKSLDEHKAAGIADNQAILGAISSNLSLYDANIKAGKGADAATSAYNTNLTGLEKQLAAAGELTPQIQALIDKYLKVPAHVATTVTANTAPAEKALAGFKDTVEKLPDGHTFTIRVALHEDAAAANLLGRATGQHVAFGAGDYLDSAFAFGNRGGEGGARWSQPPAPITVDNHIAPNVILDGQVVARSVERQTVAARAHQRHAARVGAL